MVFTPLKRPARKRVAVAADKPMPSTVPPTPTPKKVSPLPKKVSKMAIKPPVPKNRPKSAKLTPKKATKIDVRSIPVGSISESRMVNEVADVATDPDIVFDPVTSYANDIVAGKILASRHVIAACKRHLSDLKRTDIYWDLDAALNRIHFNSDALFLPFKEEPFLRPFNLYPAQMFIEGSLFGWRMINPDDGSVGYRRFQYAYIEEAKGSGKSPEVGSTMIYMVLCDGEPQAEGYVAASDKGQAMVLFRAVVALCKNSPEVLKRITFSGRLPVWQITYTKACGPGEDRLLGSFIQPIASDASQSGPVPHIMAFDEVHEIPTVKEEAIETMRAAVGKNRKQPMSIDITNSGTNPASLCYQHRTQAVRMLDGTMPNDKLFAYIAGIDVEEGSGEDSLLGDIPKGVDELEYLLAHRELWVKANPGIDHGVPGYSYVESKIKDALSIPSQKNRCLRLHFCVWTDAYSVWIGDKAWMDCGYELGSRKIDIPGHGSLRQIEADMLGRRCYGGMDLSRSDDLSSVVLIFPDDKSNLDPDSQVYTVIEYHWIDEDTFNKRAAKNPIFHLWRAEGYLIVTPGEVFDPTTVRDFILNKLSHRYLIQAIGYDRTFATQIVTTLSNDGFTMLDFAQTHYKMGAPVAEIERRVRGKLIRHGKNPLMRWEMRNVQLKTDEQMNGLIDKKRSSEKVDGPVALANAMGIMMTLNKGDEEGGSDHYAERGVIVIEDSYY